MRLPLFDQLEWNYSPYSKEATLFWKYVTIKSAFREDWGAICCCYCSCWNCYLVRCRWFGCARMCVRPHVCVCVAGTAVWMNVEHVCGSWWPRLLWPAALPSSVLQGLASISSDPISLNEASSAAFCCLRVACFPNKQTNTQAAEKKNPPASDWEPRTSLLAEHLFLRAFFKSSHADLVPVPQMNDCY